jgi:hypothetical protein
MKVYVLENSDGVRMGIFLKRSKAKRMAVTIGQHRWHEAWRIVPVETDYIEVDMLEGSDSYRRMLQTLKNQEELENKKGPVL